MANHKLPSTVAVQVTLEVPQEVSATESFGRTALTFGNDVAGVRFMGSRDEVWGVLAQASIALDRATNGEDGGT